jgi:HTH-type transcriptional regulator/antitoxin HigA
MVLTNYAVAPGEYLKEWIDDQGISGQEVADLLGYTLAQVEAILNGTVPITRDIAVPLERVVGIPVNAWIRYEAAYQADTARLSSTHAVQLIHAEGKQ